MRGDLLGATACVKGCALRIYGDAHTAPNECMRLAPPDYESRLFDADRRAMQAEATLRAHEETIGRLRDALNAAWPMVRGFVETGHPTHYMPDHGQKSAGEWADAVFGKVHDALAAAPPGEYEHRVRYNALDVAYCALADHVNDLRANGRPAAQIDEAQTCAHILRMLADNIPRSRT